MSVHLNDLSQVYLEQVSVANRARNVVANDRLDTAQQQTDDSMNRLRQQSNSNRVARADATAAANKVASDVTTSNNTGPQRPKPGTVTGRRIEDPRPTGSRPTGYRVEEKEDDEPKMKKKHKKHDREDDNGEENNDDEPRWQNSDGDNKWYEPGEDVAAPKKKKKITTEGFSNWRNDLIEVIEPERLPSKMKEGNVDNYNGKNKCVTINPEVKEQVQILESVELSEEYSYEFTDWLDYIVSEGYDISEWTIKDLYKQYKLNEAVYGNLNEKAESEQKQKLFGLALSVKRGQTPRSEVSAEVLKIVDSMSEKKIRDFAKTKHEGIPKKVEEELAPTTPKQFAAIKKLNAARREVTAADQAALRQTQKETQGNVNAGYKPEGNLVDEEVPTRLFYKLQKIGKGGSETARAQKKSSSDLETQKNLKMKAQQTKQRQEREPEEDHPSLSARERNPNLR